MAPKLTAAGQVVSFALLLHGCSHEWDRFSYGKSDASKDAQTSDSRADGARDRDAGAPDASDDCGGFVFGWPEPIEELNTQESEWTPSMRADGLEIFWAKYQTIYSARRDSIDEPFSEIGPVSSIGGNDEPQLLNNGLVLYFNDANDVYRAERSSPEGLFGTVRLVEIEGFVGQVSGFHVTQDEKTLYIGRGDSESTRIEVAERSHYQLPFSNLREVSSLHVDGLSRSAPILVDSLMLYTVGVSPLRIGYAEKSGPNPEDFVEVGLLALGDTGGDADPWLTPDGHTLVFATLRGEGDFNLFTAERICE